MGINTDITILNYLQSTMVTYLQGVIPLDHINRRLCLCAFCRRRRAFTGSGCLSHNFNIATLSIYNLSNWPTECTNSCFIISLLHSNTCFEHYCAHHEVKLYYTASRIVTHCRCAGAHRTATYGVWRYRLLYNKIWPPDDEHNSARNM